MDTIIENIFKRNDCDFFLENVENVKNSSYTFGHNSKTKNDILLGIIVKTLNFTEITLSCCDILLSKITPEHFIKSKGNTSKGNDYYISHFFHEPLFLFHSQYAPYVISSDVEYQLIFVSIDTNTNIVKNINRYPCDEHVLDFHSFRYSGGMFGPYEIDTGNRIYILTNDKYVKQLNYWFYENNQNH